MIPRQPGSRHLWLAMVVMAPVAAGAAWILRAYHRPAPSLDGLDPLLAARRFDEVERRVRDYLRVHPESLRAHILMAQVALERDDQKPRLALDHLARIQPRDR